MDEREHDVYHIYSLTCLSLSYPDEGLPGKSSKSGIGPINHSSVRCRADATLGVVVDTFFLLLLEGSVHLVLDPVVVEPPVDGGGLDAADGQEATAGPGCYSHGKQAGKQRFTLPTAETDYSEYNGIG